MFLIPSAVSAFACVMNNTYTYANGYTEGFFCMNHGLGLFYGLKFKVYEVGSIAELKNSLVASHLDHAGLDNAGDDGQLLSFIVGDLSRQGKNDPDLISNTSNSQIWRNWIWYLLDERQYAGIDPNSFATLEEKYFKYIDIYNRVLKVTDPSSEVTITASNPDVVVPDSNGIIGPFTITYPYDILVDELIKVVISVDTTSGNNVLFDAENSINKLQKADGTPFQIGDTEFYLKVEEVDYGAYNTFKIDWEFEYYAQGQYAKLMPQRQLYIEIECKDCGAIKRLTNTGYFRPNSSGSQLELEGNWKPVADDDEISSHGLPDIAPYNYSNYTLQGLEDGYYIEGESHYTFYGTSLNNYKHYQLVEDPDTGESLGLSPYPTTVSHIKYLTSVPKEDNDKQEGLYDPNNNYGLQNFIYLYSTPTSIKLQAEIQVLIGQPNIKISLDKVDAILKTQLSGVEFQVTVENGAVVVGNTVSNPFNFTTNGTTQEIEIKPDNSNGLVNQIVVRLTEVSPSDPDGYLQYLSDIVMTFTWNMQSSQWELTNLEVPDFETVTQTLGTNQNEWTINAENRPKIELSGVVWIDEPTGEKKIDPPDGYYNGNESPKAGVEVYLYKSDGTWVREDGYGNMYGTDGYLVTDANGAYKFENLPKLPNGQSYYIVFRYDGINYIRTVNGQSKATESDRAAFNNRFKTISAGQSNDGTQLSYNYDGNSISTLITEDGNGKVLDEFAVKANTTTANEYNVESSVPTSEDLYVKGDVYSYKFIEDIEEIAESETIQVKVVQEYYTNLDTGAKSSVSTRTFPVTLDYSYYQVNKAELYDLKNLELENGAIKYYKKYDPVTGTYTEYMEDKAILDVTKEIPSIVYNKPAQVMEITLGSTYLGRLTKEGNTYVITLNDIAYVKPKDLDEKYNSENLSEVLGVFGELTKINLQKLIITMPGQAEADGVIILTGNSYQLNQKTEALKEGVNYLPYTPGRAPLYSFLEDKGLYVKEKAVNQTYQTRMTGVYKMIQAVVSDALQSYDPATVEHARNPIAVNQLSVHTPIINKTEIKVSDAHKKTIQLIDQGVAGTATILTLEEAFRIDIPNNGAHKSDSGYGTKDYNHNGLLANDTNKLIKDKSDALNDKLMTPLMYQQETEEKSIGPAFAEYKLIKFPYDVYLVSGDNGTSAGKNIAPKDGSTLFKANEWYNLYEYLAPNVTKYTFVIPVWVKDAHKYEGTNGIHVLIVAENCDAATLNAAKANPLSITATGASNTNRNDYILRWSKDTYVSGRVYDLQIRDTDDPGFMGKVKPALSGDKETASYMEMPVAQKGQVTAYNLGMKLGYRFYFDLKTKGITNKTVNIKPKIYYVSTDGTVKSDISLFYHAKGSLYNKLTDNDLNIKMTMAGTHGLANNAGYTVETVAAKQLVPSRVFTNVVAIGKIMGGLSLQRDTEKLPFDNILQAAKAYGFGEDKVKFTTSALTSESIANENEIKNATGHWYGEYYLPASTIVVEGAGTTREDVIKGTKKPLATGYLVVVFEEITTVEDDPEANYLTYSAPAETQWQKEGLETTILLPNNKQATITATNGSAMAIYQVGLRANNDYETEGTH